MTKQYTKIFLRQHSNAMKLENGRRHKVLLPVADVVLIARIVHSEVERLIVARCRGPHVTDDDAGREYLFELLRQSRLAGRVPVQLLSEAKHRAPWMPKAEAEAMVFEIDGTPPHLLYLEPEALGKTLRVTKDERDEHALWHMQPHDMTEQEMDNMRKERDRERKKKERAADGAKPHAESLSQTQPWVALGISRSTYDRRRKRDENSSGDQKAGDENSSVVTVTRTPDEISSNAIAKPRAPDRRDAAHLSPHRKGFKMTDEQEERLARMMRRGHLPEILDAMLKARDQRDAARTKYLAALWHAEQYRARTCLQ